MRKLLPAVMIVYAWRSTDFVLKVADARGFKALTFPWLELQMLLSILFTILLHETGHCLAGRTVGWRCFRFQIGPVEWVQKAAGWKLQRSRSGLGGAVACTPPSLLGFRKSSAVFSAGGPMASLLQVLVFGLAAGECHSRAAFWLFANTALIGSLAVFSLVPTRQGFQLSDGSKLWRLICGGRALAELQRRYLINMSVTTPIRPRDWPREAIGSVLDGPGPCNRHDRYLAYLHLLDSERAEDAHPWLARYAKEWDKTDPGDYAVEAAYYLGVYERNASGSELWLKRALKDKSVSVSDRLRAEAASAWAAGRTEEAERAARTALAKLDDELPSGWIEYERARLNHLLHQGATPAPDAMIVW